MDNYPFDFAELVECRLAQDHSARIPCPTRGCGASRKVYLIDISDMRRGDVLACTRCLDVFYNCYIVASILGVPPLDLPVPDVWQGGEAWTA